MHKHKCSNCGNIWEHSDNTPDICKTDEELTKAHTCSECGEIQFFKYFGEDEKERVDEFKQFLNELIKGIDEIIREEKNAKRKSQQKTSKRKSFN